MSSRGEGKCNSSTAWSNTVHVLADAGAEAEKGNGNAIRSSTMGGGMGGGVRAASLTACAKRLIGRACRG
jgi:hypothetical protein